ncbi:putative potassium transport flavoprotein [Pavlovales sp. CCMP2436]|nr:putative potassium transport flavoprotein [Pavlovales sp. CCMP2436]
MLLATADSAALSALRLRGEATRTQEAGIVEAWFDFQTLAARGRGHVRLRAGKAFTVLTSMTELKGYEEATGSTRPLGVEHSVARGGRQTWLEGRQTETAQLGYTRQPFVVIVGGGQGGIVLAARLRKLSVPCIVVEKNARAGDSWRNRYKSLCLHDPVWYDHLPYLPFPADWPVFCPKDKLGDWLESYVSLMEINYWTSSVAKKAVWDAESAEWHLTVEREGETLSLRPKHLVIALGVSGYPSVPQLPGRDVFAGEQHHSSAHRDSAAYAGKRCVVLGGNNSAHDICASLWEAGAEVTMVQRSSTCVVTSDSLVELGIKPLYSDEAVARGIDTDTADLILASQPYALQAAQALPMYKQIRERDAQLYARLAAAGFLLDFGEDGSGLWLKYVRRGSGYYIDVGASELVANGSVQLRAGVGIAHLNKESVTLTDGAELPCDVLVYATGYGSMNSWLADLISPEVADQVGKVWGLGSGTIKDTGPWEGELRNLWKPTSVEGLWIMGGNLHQARHYSLCLALQLKARLEGVPTPVFAQAPVHHTR